MRIIYAFLLVVIVSCNSPHCEDEDSAFLLGRYSLNNTLTYEYNNKDTTILPLIKKNNWDKIILVVKENKYYFDNCEEYFRKYEGSWETIDIDGACYVLIHQKEGTRNLPVDPFTIAVTANEKVILLPFRK